MRQQGEVFIDLSQLQTWHLLCHGFRLCLVDEGFLPRHFPIHEPWHRQAPTIGGKATADPDLGADVLPVKRKKTRGKRPNRWLLGPGRSGHHVRGHTEPECLGKAEHDHNDDFHKNPPMTSPKVGKIITALFEGFYPKISENLDPPSTPGRVTTRIITLLHFEASLRIPSLTA